MAGFFSTAMKYPCWSMSVKTNTCRNIAPPMQLKPKVWKSTWIRRSGLGAVFMIIVNVKSYYFNLYVVNPSTRQSLIIHPQYQG